MLTPAIDRAAKSGVELYSKDELAPISLRSLGPGFRCGVCATSQRKFAPYIGFAYSGNMAHGRLFASAGETTSDHRFVFGLSTVVLKIGLRINASEGNLETHEDHVQMSDMAGSRCRHAHGSHDRHAGHSVAMFRDNFGLVLLSQFLSYFVDRRSTAGLVTPRLPSPARSLSPLSRNGRLRFMAA